MTTHKIVPLGYTDNTGGSCYYIDIGEMTVLVDCGVCFGSSTQYPDFNLIGSGEIDAVFLTHAHMEQVGGLLQLEKSDAYTTNAPIICTQPTAALLHILLQELMKESSLEGDVGPESHFTPLLLSRVLDRLEGVHYGKGEQGDIQYQFGNAGHVLGSGWLSLNAENHRTVFTGHLGVKGLLLDGFAELPTADSLVLETMYHTPEQNQSIDTARQTLLDSLNQAISKGIPVLIPADAAGISQEVLRLLQQEATNVGSNGFNILFDEIIHNTTEVHTNYLSESYYSSEFLQSVSDADITDFVPIGSRPISTQIQRESLFDNADEGDGDTKVIITSGAAFERGSAQFHLYQFADHLDEAAIILLGHMSKNSVGDRLVQAERESVEVTIRPTMSADFAEATQQRGVGSFEKTVKIPQSWITHLPGFGRYPNMETISNMVTEVDPGAVYFCHQTSKANKLLRETVGARCDASFISASQGVPFSKDQ